MTRRARSLAIALATALAACSQPREPIVDCAPSDDARPVCGFQNPEDFALLPDGATLVVSEMGEMDGSVPGALVFFALATDARTPAFGGPDTPTGPATQGWGDAACPGAPGPAFSPHGLSLARRSDEALELLVVNHGGREAVEFFELDVAGTAPRAVWRGCAVAPPDSYLNDVASLPGGGFAVTHMMSRSRPGFAFLKSLVGLDTGWVYEWQPGSGFRRVPGSDGAMPNGIAASPDGESLYVDLYLGDEVRKLARKTGERLESVEIASPDNILWSPDGSLLVASHNAPWNEMMACAELEHGACPFHFSIVELDPESLEPRALYENAGPPMGAGTAALRIGDELVIGSFKGDRLLRAKLAPETAAP